MFTRAFFALALAAVCLVPQRCSAAAAAAPRPNLSFTNQDSTHVSPRLDSTPFEGDPICPEGYHAGWEISTWQFNVPLDVWLSKTGSFIHSEWYVGPIQSSEGPDNTVGTTRTNVEGPESLFVETLVEFFETPTEQSQRFVLESGPSLLGDVYLQTYYEEFKAQSICSGNATFYMQTAAYCADKIVSSWDLFTTYRLEAVGKVASELGAKAFVGTCPPPGEK